jgi:hypothetical protein
LRLLPRSDYVYVYTKKKAINRNSAYVKQLQNEKKERKREIKKKEA